MGPSLSHYDRILHAQQNHTKILNIVADIMESVNLNFPYGGQQCSFQKTVNWSFGEWCWDDHVQNNQYSSQVR